MYSSYQDQLIWGFDPTGRASSLRGSGEWVFGLRMRMMVRVIICGVLGTAGGFHLSRIFNGMDLIVGDFKFPVWGSAILGVVLLSLCWADPSRP